MLTIAVGLVFAVLEPCPQPRPDLLVAPSQASDAATIKQVINGKFGAIDNQQPNKAINPV
jgi:hypothetical protein